MSGAAVNLRVLQFFLGSNSGNPGVYEVSSDMDTGNLFCTCPGFGGRGICKHVKLVKHRMEENGGTYPMRVLSDATEADKEHAESSPEAFRTFVSRFGEIIEY
jgi:hypothetical protein